MYRYDDLPVPEIRRLGWNSLASEGPPRLSTHVRKIFAQMVRPRNAAKPVPCN